MGVHGLWKLVEPSGKTVPLETLENKVLAVDVSIWLHQAIKGFQDARGGTVPNAHLLSVYHRICKLLYFKIKPVFVFDGGVPVLKKETIAKRNQLKQKNLTEADYIHRSLINTLLKHSAISKVLSEKTKAAITSPTKQPNEKTKSIDSLYFLPPDTENEKFIESSSSSEEEDSPKSGRKHWDLHSIDTNSVEFKSLPADVKHEILTDLKETRKQNSWGRINELPTQSDDFSVYQMKRLLKRQSVQAALEEVEKEMGGHSLSLGELEKILKDQGVITSQNPVGNRIASDENTRYLLIKDVKQAIEEAKKKKELETIAEENDAEMPSTSKENQDLNGTSKSEEESKNKGDLEYEEELKRAIALSLEEQPSTSKLSDDEPSSTSNKILKIEEPSSKELKIEEVDNEIELKESPEHKIIELGKSSSNETSDVTSTKETSEEESLKEEAKNFEPSSSEVPTQSTQNTSMSFLGNVTDADFESDSSDDQEADHNKLSLAQSYMMEYSGLTPSEIAKIIAGNQAKPQKKKVPKLSNQKKIIPDEDNLQKAIPKEILEENVDEVEIMSSSDSDDFEEVIEESESNVNVMEVVVKPTDKLEDDLFADIFGDSDQNDEPKIVEEAVEEPKQKSETLKDKIDKIIQQYSKPKESEAVTDKVDSKEVLIVEKETPKKILEEEKIKESPKEVVEEKAKKSAIISVEQMKEIKDNLEEEQRALSSDKAMKERLATNISEQIRQETQELLELFGVPYLVAPMEAEAQCAFLEQIDLTDGTITDDSDIWLFGGRTVYKNFFNNNKLVQEFRIENIQHHFKLTRDQMILLAMLVGSDYTTGLQGVGPVTALEILAAFPPRKEILSGLFEFKGWVKRGKVPEPGRTALISKLKNLVLNEGFPSFQVVKAYLEPKVETSKENFSWAKPDKRGLIEFAKRKFGWTNQKSEEILNPIMKRLDDTKLQKTIKDFFKVQYQNEVDRLELAETKLSKRVKTALTRLGRNPEDPDFQEEEKTVSSTSSNKKTKAKVGTRRKTKDEEPSTSTNKKRRPNKSSKNFEDCDIEELKELEKRSAERVQEIEKEILEKQRKVSLEKLHKREVIPQRQKEKTDMMRNKMKAIEIFRKSKQGPGYVKKNQKAKREPKQDASYLSEGSSSD